MNAHILRPTRQRQVLALSMALVVAFLGIAVFSSLHKHQGTKTRCSLNGFDQLMTGEAEAGQIVHSAVAVGWQEARPAPRSAAFSSVDSLFLRGPPAAA